MTTRRQRRGRDAERAVARYLGGDAERIAGVGRRDVDGGWYAAEIKEREKPLPRWLLDAIEQAERLARPDQLAIAVFHHLGDSRGEDLVVMRLREFRDRFCGEGDK